MVSATGAAIGLDHVGIVGADLDALAEAFAALGFHLTPRATHAGGRTANRCIMLRDGGYLELMATVTGQTSATLARFLARGAGAHILALEVADAAAADARLRRAGIIAEAMTTTRDAAGAIAKFAVLLPPDPPEGRVLLLRHLTRDVLWRPDAPPHPNRALSLLEAVYATDAPAPLTALLSRLSGRPAEPDPLGGYRIPLARGTLRVLPRGAAMALFPNALEPNHATGAPIVGVTIAVAADGPVGGVVQAGGLAIRFVAMA